MERNSWLCKSIIHAINKMDEQDFEGTLVLEKLARIDAVAEFMEAADYQNYARAEEIMKEAGIDEETIAITLKKMADPYDEH